MTQPRPDAAYFRFVLYLRYLIYRLRVARRDEDAKSVSFLLTQLKALGRAWEDAAEPVADGRAERDVCDLVLDTKAGTVRFKLLSRFEGADKVSPYVDIFPEGVGEYKDAPVSSEAEVYGRLRDRMSTYLAEGDELRAMIPEIDAALGAWQSAITSLTAAQNQEALARQALETCITEVRAEVERVYGRLVADLGKKDAEPYFPKP